jgi:organic hydroperoxide reductase OsmC/OhrA
MSEHRATIRWERTGPDFLHGRYSREHTWAFDGGLTLPASSSPDVVPAPWSSVAAVDPEEAFVAAVASCHMLWFLSIAANHGFQADAYFDEATGVMTNNALGRGWISTVLLRPRIVWSGVRLPTAAELEQLHHKAHEQCFIANSIKTEVKVALS